jgi:hypothetical protein
MATIIASAGATAREPLIALSVTLDRSVPGLPSVVEFASVVDLIPQLFTMGMWDANAFDIRNARTGGVQSLVVVADDAEPSHRQRWRRRSAAQLAPPQWELAQLDIRTPTAAACSR